ncbi:MAG: HU family DNA-binding protein [Deltaproteobacteria bacterium]|nr:HU family DNA-binding protein [Deltaproteobacteria bacterium]MBW2051437.1 HU family DNA-binding protein [Deltaproteobacteria bacterium]MBW2140896.1 HU family DNA-binding protein [Deltaproteobacteria bacterium]MBW2323346.1 HU family DNA-binding protein [Deltaproteobacteria bacterium]
MTKADLVAKIASDTKLTKADSERALNAFLGNVTKTLKKEGKLTLTGFGTFEVSKRKKRKGRNPQTGEAINIKARKVVKFKPGKGLKDTIK